MTDTVAKVGGGQLGRNNRITANQFLNRHCASGLDLESILLARMRKIFLQQYLPTGDISSSLDLPPAAERRNRKIDPTTQLPRCYRRCGSQPIDMCSLGRCSLEVVVGMDVILLRLWSVAIEAYAEVDLLVRGLVRFKCPIFPLAVALILRIVRTPPLALFHDGVAAQIGFDEAPIGAPLTGLPSASSCAL